MEVDSLARIYAAKYISANNADKVAQELYDIMEVSIKSDSKEKQESTTVEILKPLNFSAPFRPKEILDTLEKTVPKDDHDHVAHYFDIRVDDEIDPKILCELDPLNTKMGVHADERAALCQDVLNKNKKLPFNIYEDLKEDIPGDIC